jgi:hypothetical protein
MPLKSNPSCTVNTTGTVAEKLPKLPRLDLSSLFLKVVKSSSREVATTRNFSSEGELHIDNDGFRGGSLCNHSSLFALWVVFDIAQSLKVEDNDIVVLVIAACSHQWPSCRDGYVSNAFLEAISQQILHLQLAILLFSVPHRDDWLETEFSCDRSILVDVQTGNIVVVSHHKILAVLFGI